jgi:hypothetical protein
LCSSHSYRKPLKGTADRARRLFAKGEGRTWRKAEALDDLTTHSKALRMTAGVPYETSNSGRGQNLLLA